jgi:hypothetical protein
MNLQYLFRQPHRENTFFCLGTQKWTTRVKKSKDYSLSFYYFNFISMPANSSADEKEPDWGPLLWRYEKPRPRKMLSLDGGGMRGILTLEILLEMERKLRETLKQGDDFRLADYFDYIGGTSTGAIIAAGLSLGKSAQELLDFYQEKGEAMFDKAFLLNKVKYFYNDGPLAKELKKTFGDGDLCLSSGAFKCLLLIVTMNRSTDSPWPISNNPFAKYNHPVRPDRNTKVKLYQLVRASTAAPVYFKPETLQWDAANPEKTFVFVDGGVTPYNNPAFLLYKMATLPAYKLCWKTGEKELLIISVGTGASPSPGVYDNVLDTLKELPNNLMYAMQVDQDVNCRMTGRCTFGAQIDRELGSLIPDQPIDKDMGRQFLYARYNADLSQEGLEAMRLGHIDSQQVRKMDSVKYLDELREVGRAAAREVSMAHFGSFVPQP